MNFPINFLDSVKHCQGFNEQQFIDSHNLPANISVRINPTKKISQFNLNEKVLWCDEAYYLTEKPQFIFDPLLHAGCYYVQEASSMFLQHALKLHVDFSNRQVALDLCASPGGKSSILSSLLGNSSLLVANDVIKARAVTLKENLIKWNSFNTIVTNNDPSHFKRLENFFDLMVVDAPCSGSGLFRKEEDSKNEWSLENVNLSAQRQKRILADVISALKIGGKLFYSTCSYSEKENEDICDWLCTEFELESLKIPIEYSWGIEETISKNTNAFGYRFYPGKVKGEGFFIAAFQKKGNLQEKKIPFEKNLPLASKNEITVCENFIADLSNLQYIKVNEEINVFNSNFKSEISQIKKNLYLLSLGTEIGKIVRDELLPSHSLALSSLLNNNILFVELDLENAIKFLRRDDLKISTEKTGWHLVKYQNHSIGWIKSLGNRINNYYPKEWRILKHYSGNS